MRITSIFLRFFSYTYLPCRGSCNIMSYPTVDANEVFKLSYVKKIVQPGFCIGFGPTVFTKNETMICGLNNIDMADDCLKYEFINPGYFVGGALILPCKRYITQSLIVMEPQSGSNHQSPNFNILFISMMLFFIFYLKR